MQNKFLLTSGLILGLSLLLVTGSNAISAPNMDVPVNTQTLARSPTSPYKVLTPQQACNKACGKAETYCLHNGGYSPYECGIKAEACYDKCGWGE